MKSIRTTDLFQICALCPKQPRRECLHASLTTWPQLFNGWTALSIGQITIQWIEIYPVNSATTGAWRIIICLKFFSQHTRRDTVRRQLLHELMIIFLERSMIGSVSFLFFRTSQWPLTPLTTKYYSHDSSVATVSKVMLWPGCAHISQIGSNTSEWRMIVHLSTSWPVVRDLC